MLETKSILSKCLLIAVVNILNEQGIPERTAILSKGPMRRAEVQKEVSSPSRKRWKVLEGQGLRQAGCLAGNRFPKPPQSGEPSELHCALSAATGMIRFG